MRVALFTIFLFSAVTMPWWFVIPFGILILTMPYGAPVAIVGGVLLDALYGAPIQTLFNFQYLYTTIFICAALAMEFLSDRVVD